MLLPQFSGQQLLCKGINETGGARERQPGRDRRRGGGLWAKVGGRALGLRSMVFFFSCEMVCMFTTPAVWLWRVCFGGVGYVMGKSMTFCLIFEEVKHGNLPLAPHCLTTSAAPQRDHTDQKVLVLICFVFPATKWLLVTVSVASWVTASPQIPTVWGLAC